MTRPSWGVDEAVRWLDQHINLEATAGKVDGLSLDRMRALLALLGEPQLDLTAIHVTGTNGKGSTAAIATGVLSAAGLSVGTYSSPHVTRINERLALAGQPIDDDDLAVLLADVRVAAELLDEPPSWFELVTAAAFRWFADVAVDVAVVEVGKLGRYDATNVLEAPIAVVTNVAEDHTDGAEGWRQAVAWEKAGIIGAGSTLVLGETDPELRDVFLAEQPGSTLVRGVDFALTRNQLAVGGRLLDVETPAGQLDELFLPLHGAYQGENAAIAITAAEAFLGATPSAEVVEDGLAAVTVPGRFEVVGRSPLIIIDGAHNPDGAAEAAATLAEDFGPAGSLILVVGFMQDKDPPRMLTALGAQHAGLVITTAAKWARAHPAEELAAVARSLGAEAEAVADPIEALRRARALATADDVIFVAGSLYIAGAVRDLVPTL